jgi:hypothetical protein
MYTSFFNSESLSFIPITEYVKYNVLNNQLEHGFQDIPFFPTWEEFLKRSLNQTPKYPNYMTYLLCKSESKEIIGLLAVQLQDYEQLKGKVQIITYEIPKYLYLSWIALDSRYRKWNYFSQLFEFYRTLICRARSDFKVRIEGAAIAIRRMRPLLWNLLNTNEPCPSTTNEIIHKKTHRITYVIKPGEMISSTIDPVQDHLLIIFNKRTE